MNSVSYATLRRAAVVASVVFALVALKPQEAQAQG